MYFDELRLRRWGATVNLFETWIHAVVFLIGGTLLSGGNLLLLPEGAKGPALGSDFRTS